LTVPGETNRSFAISRGIGVGFHVAQQFLGL
jgi:hypothetical protein